MRLLLDTHILLWALAGSPRLSKLAEELIRDPANDLYVSTASIWEIAIKHALGKGDMPISGARAAHLCAQAGYRELPVAWRHTRPSKRCPPTIPTPSIASSSPRRRPSRCVCFHAMPRSHVMATW
ncbi:MAG: type II toxin-antitoxin system VapC family toxin [Rhodocyclaceae bacterium]|nr:type II toxin-antitoxin system VapC family toxin [Rhodocyclaceae bacterium]